MNNRKVLTLFNENYYSNFKLLFKYFKTTFFQTISLLILVKIRILNN